MLLIHKTVSICDSCYKHIPANLYEEDNLIKMVKSCPEHGLMESIVEVDKDFYYDLYHREYNTDFTHVLFEASDRCQLTCPHCYHLPDNKIQDVPIDMIVKRLEKFPRTSVPTIAGAEPTLRPDFIELCQAINDMKFPRFSLLTNGLRFHNIEFAQDAYKAGLQYLALGLNHYSYQGKTVHRKQLEALSNVLDTGYIIEYVGYTIESYDHLPEILEEIKAINHPNITHYRIRCGSFIGRSIDKQRGYLSVLVKKMKELIGGELEPYPNADDNPYHVMLLWNNNIKLRLIQWPDVTNIDMEELSTGPWCQFYDDSITNFVHQVIMRDAIKNNSLPQLDVTPAKFQHREITTETEHWKHDFTGPKEVDAFDLTFEPDSIPGRVKKVIQLKNE